MVRTEQREAPQRIDVQKRCDVLVLDARERQSLIAIRSLGRKGLRVAALESVDRLLAPAFLSRWCRCSELLRTATEGTEAYFAGMERFLDQTGAGVLLTTSDGTLALLRQHRATLEQRVRLALAKEAALDIAVNKERTLEVASSLGLAIPRAVRIYSAGELREAVREVGLPAVIKPIESWVDNEQKRKRLLAKLVVTADEASKAVEELVSPGNGVLFQQFLSGRREAMHFMYASGQMYARYAQWAKRTYPPLGGASVLRQSIEIPYDTGIQAERLVREIDLEGYSEVEFRRGGDGKPYLMEINPRLSGSIELPVSLGVDFPYLLYQWASGAPIDTIEGYQTGRWMRYLGADILTTVDAIRERGRPGIAPPARVIFDFCSSFCMPTRYDYVDWSDPLPLGIAVFGSAGRLWQKIGEKLNNSSQNFLK